MHKKERYIVGFVRDLPRLPVGPQKARMHAKSITKIYTNVELLIKQRIDGIGDVVAVDLAMVFADPADAKKAGGKSASAMKVISALERKGVEIWQLDGDLWSGKFEQRDQMLTAMFASFQRRRYETTKRGRKENPFTAAQMAIVEPIWRNIVKYATNTIAKDAAIAALKKAGLGRHLSVQVLIKRLGASGRGKIKAATKRKR